MNTYYGHNILDAVHMIVWLWLVHCGMNRLSCVVLMIGRTCSQPHRRRLRIVI